MRLVEVDPRTVNTYRNTKWQVVIDEFLRMDVPMVKMITDKPVSAQAACNLAIKRFRYNDVRARMINRETYLVRPSKLPEVTL